MNILKKKIKEPTPLEQVITALLADMQLIDSDSEEYANMADQLTKLYKLKEIDTPDRRVSSDTLALIGANILGMLLVIHSERVGIITSKAVGFVIKPKV